MAGLAALASGLSPSAATVSATDQVRSAPARPDRVVIIVVDALSREIVDKYGMTNAQQLMVDGVDAPKKPYLGHVGSVTVVTHNVITPGLLPKHMGWSSEGYRDVDGVLASLQPNDRPTGSPGLDARTRCSPCRAGRGLPELADYLHEFRPESKVITISPKTYAAWGFGGPTSDMIITFSGRSFDCDGDCVNNWRGPTGVNVPEYLTDPACGRCYVDSSSSKFYDTNSDPPGCTRWTATATPSATTPTTRARTSGRPTQRSPPCSNEDWSGMFVSLPGVDKAAHMWGRVDDPGGADPMSHLDNATAVADAQIGKIMDYLESSGELDHTMVVLTSDHGSVPGTHFHGINDGTVNGGYNNWYFGVGANGTYLKPQPALQPLVDTGNLAQGYSDSQLAYWLNDHSRARMPEAVGHRATDAGRLRGVDPPRPPLRPVRPGLATG